MIIWGSQGREVELSSGEFHCPNCGSQQVYKHIRFAQYFTLYFIPIFQTQNLGEYVRCQRCELMFKEGVLDYQRHAGGAGLTKPQNLPPSLNVGDRVLAQWAHDQFFYPGEIRASGNGSYEIRYDDGDSAWVTAEQIASFDITEGDQVFARWQGGKFYYAGIIDEQDGETIHVCYADGDQEWTSVSMVRVERQKKEPTSATGSSTQIKRDSR